jgi:hypothetical protein
MKEPVLFLMEIIISISISSLVIIALSKVLEKLLVDLCGTENRAKFWVIYSNVMLYLVPLLMVIMFGKSSVVSGADFGFFKAAFGYAIFGVFSSLLVVGTQITSAIPKRRTK